MSRSSRVPSDRPGFVEAGQLVQAASSSSGPYVTASPSMLADAGDRDEWSGPVGSGYAVVGDDEVGEVAGVERGGPRAACLDP